MSEKNPPKIFHLKHSPSVLLLVLLGFLMVHGLLCLLRPDLRRLRRVLLGLQWHLRGIRGDGPPIRGRVRHGRHGGHRTAAIQGDLAMGMSIWSSPPDFKGFQWDFSHRGYSGRSDHWLVAYGYEPLSDATLNDWGKKAWKSERRQHAPTIVQVFLAFFHWVNLGIRFWAGAKENCLMVWRGKLENSLR